MNVWLVLIVGNEPQVTPVPVALRYWPFPPVVPSWTPIVLLNLALAANVVTPAMLTLSKFVWPSTSKSPLTSTVTVVVTPVTFKLSAWSVPMVLTPSDWVNSLVAPLL